VAVKKTAVMEKTERSLIVAPMTDQFPSIGMEAAKSVINLSTFRRRLKGCGLEKLDPPMKKPGLIKSAASFSVSNCSFICSAGRYVDDAVTGVGDGGCWCVA